MMLPKPPKQLEKILEELDETALLQVVRGEYDLETTSKLWYPYSELNPGLLALRTFTEDLIMAACALHGYNPNEIQSEVPTEIMQLFGYLDSFYPKHADEQPQERLNSLYSFNNMMFEIPTAVLNLGNEDNRYAVWLNAFNDARDLKSGIVEEAADRSFLDFERINIMSIFKRKYLPLFSKAFRAKKNMKKFINEFGGANYPLLLAEFGGNSRNMVFTAQDENIGFYNVLKVFENTSMGAKEFAIECEVLEQVKRAGETNLFVMHNRTGYFADGRLIYALLDKAGESMLQHIGWSYYCDIEITSNGNHIYHLNKNGVMEVVKGLKRIIDFQISDIQTEFSLHGNSRLIVIENYVAEFENRLLSQVDLFREHHGELENVHYDKARKTLLQAYRNLIIHELDGAEFVTTLGDSHGGNVLINLNGTKLIDPSYVSVGTRGDDPATYMISFMANYTFPDGAESMILEQARKWLLDSGIEVESESWRSGYAQRKRDRLFYKVGDHLDFLMRFGISEKIVEAEHDLGFAMYEVIKQVESSNLDCPGHKLLTKFNNALTDYIPYSNLKLQLVQSTPAVRREDIPITSHSPLIPVPYVV